MQYELVYDVAISEAPRHALGLGLIILTLAGIWAMWLKRRKASIHVAVRFLGGIGVFMLALSGVYRWEQHYIASRTDIQVIEGEVTNHWTDRVRRAGKSNDYTEWEGFRVNGLPFSYARNVDQNYFHNAHRIDISNGQRFRLRYVINGERKEIVSVEKALH